MSSRYPVASGTDDEASVEMARWLVEVGHRKIVRRPEDTAQAVCEAAGGRGDRARRFVLLGLLGAATLQYLYLDAMLEVAGLRSLIVFVFSRAGA